MESQYAAWILLGLTSLCWLLGVWLPIVELIPFPALRGQELPSFVDISGYGHISEPVYKSTWSTLFILNEKKFVFAFCILLTSSIIIPCLKLLAAFLVLFDRGIVPARVVTILAKLSTYQLVDLFVTVLFLSFCNSDIFAANVMFGFYCFASYCVLSIVLMLYLESRYDAVTRVSPLGQSTETFSSTPYQLAPNAAESKPAKKLEADASAAFWNGLVFLLLVRYANHQPILDTAVTFNGIAMSRTTLGLLDLGMSVGKRFNPVICMMLLASAIVAPLVVSAAALVGALLKRYGHNELSDNALSVSHSVAKWVTADVMALSLVTFLFAVQGDHLHTTIPDGTAFGITTDWFSGFYVCLALGAASITLKLKAVHWHHDDEDDDSAELEHDGTGASQVETGTALSSPLADHVSMKQQRYAAVPLSETGLSIDQFPDSPGSPSMPSMRSTSNTPKDRSSSPLRLRVPDERTHDSKSDAKENATTTPASKSEKPSQDRVPTVSSSEDKHLGSSVEGRCAASTSEKADKSFSEFSSSIPSKGQHDEKQEQALFTQVESDNAKKDTHDARSDLITHDEIAQTSVGQTHTVSAPVGEKLSNEKQGLLNDSKWEDVPLQESSVHGDDTQVTSSAPSAEVEVHAAQQSITPGTDTKYDQVTSTVDDTSIPQATPPSTATKGEADPQEIATLPLESQVPAIDETGIAPAVVLSAATEEELHHQHHDTSHPDHRASSTVDEITIALGSAVEDISPNVEELPLHDAVNPICESNVQQQIPSASLDVVDGLSETHPATDAPSILQEKFVEIVEPATSGGPLESPETTRELISGERSPASSSVVVAESPLEAPSSTSQGQKELPDENTVQVDTVDSTVEQRELDGDTVGASQPEQETIVEVTDGGLDIEVAVPVDNQEVGGTLDDSENQTKETGDVQQRDIEMALPSNPREVEEDTSHGMRPPAELGQSYVQSSSSKVPKTQTPNSKCNKLLSNPIFHVKAASWVIWGLCYFCVRGPEQFTYMKLNHALDGVLPLLNNVINHTLPRTIGDCNQTGLAPLPCVGDGPIYKGNSSGIGMKSLEEQRVVARWVTGVNTVHLNSVSLQVIPDSRKPIQVGISGEVVDMKMSIRIQQCLLGACRTVWDNVGGCCKPRRQFKLVIATECDDSDKGMATLGSFKVEWFNIDDIKLSENILGFFKQELADLTPRVKKAVQKLTTNIFQGDTMFLNMTFAQVVSRLWRYNTAGGARCSDFLADTE